MAEKKANHTAPVVRIGEILTHPNANKLEITHVMDGAYQVVIGKGNFKTGDLAVYIQPDSVAPQTEPFKWIWQDHVGLDGTVPERRRRITVKKLRGEWSEGLLMPLSDFPAKIGVNGERIGLGWEKANIGDDLSDLIGITHYDPDTTANTAADNLHIPRHKYPKSLRGWFFFILHRLGLKVASREYAMEVSFGAPTYDVDALKNYRRVLTQGEQVLVTEKIHGSNWRATVVDGVQYVGSHYQWKQKGDNAFWKALTPEIEQFCHLNQKAIVFGELAPTQKGFTYGAEEPEVFPFDVYREDTGYDWAGNEGLTNTAPIIYDGPYDEALVEGWANGQTLVPGAKHMREGCVIRTVPARTVRGLGRVQLKVVSKAFLEAQGKQK